jgi:hypothetical protein
MTAQKWKLGFQNWIQKVDFKTSLPATWNRKNKGLNIAKITVKIVIR